MYCECGCGKITNIRRKKRQRFIQGHNLNTLSKEQKGNWKGGRTMHTNGYILIHSPDHPYCDSHKYVPLHRLVKEEELTILNGIKTYIHPSLEIDHKDGNKLNNHPSNLAIMSKGEHSLRHIVERKRINGRFVKDD